MTAKELRTMRRLEIKIEELGDRLERSTSACAEQHFAIADTRAAMRSAYEALVDAENVLYMLMRDDPAFMQQFPQPMRAPSRGMKTPESGEF